jgi:hypothetical protein
MTINLIINHKVYFYDRYEDIHFESHFSPPAIALAQHCEDWLGVNRFELMPQSFCLESGKARSKRVLR